MPELRPSGAAVTVALLTQRVAALVAAEHAERRTAHVLSFPPARGVGVGVGVAPGVPEASG